MKKILIVTANYYPEISTQLESYAIKTLSNFDCKKIYSPGVFEIPVLISKNINFFDGFVALGCVIKGETPHFDFISSSVTSGIMQLSVQNKILVTTTKFIKNVLKIIMFLKNIF